VFRSNKPNIANFRAEYAKHDDFCEVFEKDTKSLYLLAFLLTTNHKESEQCFVSTVEEAFKEVAVFKEWARSWVSRRLIENAIEIVSPVSARNSQKRDPWSAGQPETQRECEVDIVTKLSAFERFVFVMSILERLSNWDCALMLECSTSKVAQARMRALRGLPDLAGPIPRADELPSLRFRAPIGARVW
jgi:DNA-directed RNA polymerase specialized sigma24 family protein